MKNASRYARGKAIESAETVAAFRAIGCHEKDAGLRNPDRLAEKFLGPRYRLLLRLRHLTRRYAEFAYPGMYWFHLARTRHIDALLNAALDDGVEQVVFLAAGYDSRAYRFSDRLNGKRVFEVDLHGTQERKLECLEKTGVAVPDNLSFVSIDFNKQKLEDVLLAAGFDPRRKTFFNWEGVTYYLPERSVAEVLRFVNTQAAAGSRVAFDYMLQSLVDGDYSSYGSRQVIKGFNKVGEPALFGICAGATEAFLKTHGFRVLSDMGPEELEGSYTKGEEGRTRRVLGCMRVVCAEVERPSRT
ncbi:MAG: SAM-dependent methyltransferase [Gammaproteobacteria bacterium]|nr:MAG: SAM-dependent methyltransferase [Gammaproteobacteria bacterium]